MFIYLHKFKHQADSTIAGGGAVRRARGNSLVTFTRTRTRRSRTVPLVAICIVSAGLVQPVFGQLASERVARTEGVSGATAERARSDKPAEPASSASASANPGSSAAAADAGFIGGTVLDLDGAIVPGAVVLLDGSTAAEQRQATADDNGAFRFDGVRPGDNYKVTVTAKGFSAWTSSSFAIQPSQFFLVPDVRLKIEADSSSITVYASTNEIAVEQVNAEMQQRVLGIIPNFYVVYDGSNAAPLTPKLKFRLATRVMTDPITVAGVALMAGIEHAANTPDFQQGMKGYGQRFGAEAAGGATNILIGGAILPTLLHQDPRYFYQGTGGTRSRLAHALSAPFICRGDNGSRQFNFSSMGGDLGATALSMAYLPDSNRSSGRVFATFGINTAERAISAIAQEFVLPHFTSKAKRAQ